MSIVYSNDFESQFDNWSGDGLIEISQAYVPSPYGNNLRFNDNARYSGALGDVTNLSFDYSCSMFGLQIFYKDASAVEHEITFAPTCDGSSWYNSGDLTINDAVSELRLNPQGLQSAIDNLTINGLTVPGGTAGFSTSTANTLINNLGVSMYDNLSPLIPVIFGLLIVSTAVIWAFNRLVGFFKPK